MTKEVITKRLWGLGLVYEAEVLSRISRGEGNILGMKRLQVKRQRLVSIWTLSPTIFSGGGIDMIKPTPQMVSGG